jgi:hypothetical protein
VNVDGAQGVPQWWWRGRLVGGDAYLVGDGGNAGTTTGNPGTGGTAGLLLGLNGLDALT